MYRLVSRIRRELSAARLKCTAELARIHFRPLLTSLCTASDFPFRLNDFESAMVASTLPLGSSNLARQGSSGSSAVPRPLPQRLPGAWLRHSSSVGDQRNLEVSAASQSSRSDDPGLSVRQENSSSASSLQFPSRREAEPAPQEEPPLVRVRLSVHYRVHSRQMLCIGGSQIPFGWSFLSIAKVPMTWTEGDLWTTEVRCGTLRAHVGCCMHDISSECLSYNACRWSCPRIRRSSINTSFWKSRCAQALHDFVATVLFGAIRNIQP